MTFSVTIWYIASITTTWTKLITSCWGEDGEDFGDVARWCLSGRSAVSTTARVPSRLPSIVDDPTFTCGWRLEAADELINSFFWSQTKLCPLHFQSHTQTPPSHPHRNHFQLQTQTQEHRHNGQGWYVKLPRTAASRPLAGLDIESATAVKTTSWYPRANTWRLVVAGASGGIGQPLSLLLKASPLVDHLSLYDVVNTPGVTADLSHISSIATIDGYLPADDGLKKALTGADIVVIPAGIPREYTPFIHNCYCCGGGLGERKKSGQWIWS